MRNFRLTLLVVAALATVLAGAGAARAADVVARYVLNGTAADISGNGCDGVNTNNTVSWVNDPVRGTVASFDGAAGINVGASGYAVTEALRVNAQFAISFWIKPQAYDLDNDSIIDYNPVMGGASAGVIEILGDNSWLGGGTGNIGVNSGGGAGSQTNVGGSFYDGNWHHIVIQWFDPDGDPGDTTAANVASKAQVWIDGVSATMGSGVYNGKGDNPGNMLLGGPLIPSKGGGYLPNYYKGLMSDVTFFNAQLAQTDVDNLRAATVHADYTWSVSGGDGLWATGDNWGGTAPDSAANARAIVGVAGTDASIDLESTGRGVHSLRFAGDVDTTITGTGALTIGQTGDNPSLIEVNHGSVANQASEISCPVSIAGFAQTTIANAADKLTFSATVSGAGELRLTTANAGTVVLAQANPMTGSASVYGGTLKITDRQALQNAMVTVTGTGTLDVSSVAGQNVVLGSLAGDRDIALGAGTALTVGGNGNNTTYSGVLSGTGASLTKAGVGTMTLPGTNTYDGATTLSAGTLAVGVLADGGSPSSMGQSDGGPSNLVFGANTTLKHVGAADSSTDRLFTVNGNFTLESAGAGALKFTNPAVGAVTYGSAGALTLTLAGTSTAENVLSASIGDNDVAAVSLTKSGTGTWKLAGTNTFTGDTLINAGALRVAGAANLSSGGVTKFNSGTVANSGVLEGSGTWSLTAANSAGNIFWANHGGFAAGGGPLTVTLNSGAPIAWGDATGFNGKTLILGSLSADNRVLLTNDANMVNASRNIYLVDNPNSTDDYAEISGSIKDDNTGNRKLTVDGPGRLVLSGDNTFKGGLQVNHYATVTLSGTSHYSGQTVLTAGINTSTQGGILEVLNAEALGNTTDIFMTRGATLRLLSDSNMDIGKNIVALGASTNFPQIFFHVDRSPGGGGSNGTHAIGNITLAPSNDMDSRPATFTGKNGYSLNVGTFSSNRHIGIVNNIDSPGVLTFANLEAYYTGNGRIAISGSGTTVVTGEIRGIAGKENPSLTYNGTGTLRLLGTCTSAGTATLTNGTLQLGNDAALPSGSFAINGGTIEVLNSDRSLANPWTIGGDFTLTGGHRLTLANTTPSTSQINGRTITVNNANLTVNTPYHLYGNCKFQGTGGDVVFNGKLTGDTNCNLYNNMASGSVTVGDLEVTSGSNRTFTFYGTNTIKVTGAISDGPSTGTGEVFVYNAGDTVFSGANTYSRTTKIGDSTTYSGARLYVNGTHNPKSGTPEYQVYGTLGGKGTINTNGNVTVFSGGKLAPGDVTAPGTLTLNVANLNISGITGNNVGELTFRLESPGTSDQIVLGPNGTLNIGSNLDWRDFTFVAGAGLTNDVYTLIDTSKTISGSLPASGLSGPIGDGGTGTLSISGGQDLILTVTGLVLVTHGDTNGDKVVDAADFITLKKNFGKSVGSAGASAGNFTTPDEAVDWADLNILTTNFSVGGAGAPAVTPEPATLGLLMVGAVMVIKRRRRS